MAAESFFMLRSYRPEDFDAVCEVYKDAVLSLGGEFYSPGQLEVWASYPAETDSFARKLATGPAWVFEREGRVVAFGHLDPADHVSLLYCSGDYARRGIATSIYNRLEEEARKAGAVILTVEASRVSLPFFLKAGFQVVGEESSGRHGVVFERLQMAKLLHFPEATRWVVLGNSGSGKSTVAGHLSKLASVAVLDLDSIAWSEESGPLQPQRRDARESLAEMERFAGRHQRWVMEGCYEDLIGKMAPYSPVLLWKDVPVDVCCERIHSRKFEPGKYSTPQAQVEAVSGLQQWIREYESRSGPMSRRSHETLFRNWPGPKVVCPV